MVDIPAFWDADGQPVALGDEVCIQFIVTSSARTDPTKDKFPTVGLKLKRELPEGYKLKIDGTKPDESIAVSAVLMRLK